MKLSERERQWLAEIESRLIDDEPNLHHALAGMSLRPLRVATSVATVRTAVRSCRATIVLSLLTLAAGVALLVAGLAAGAPLMALAGMVAAQFGPWLVARRRRTRTSVGPPPRGRRPAGALRG